MAGVASDPERLVRAILADPRYARAPAGAPPPPAGPTIWQQLWTWFVDHVLRPIFEPLLRAVPGVANHGDLVAVAIIGVAVALLAFVAVRVGLAVAAHRRERRAERTAAGDAELLVTSYSARVWAARARVAAARGDHRAAIAALWAAARAALDEAGLVAFDAARTPGEYRRAVRAADAGIAEPFDELAGGFVRATFAPALPTAGDVTAAESALGRVAPALLA